MADDRRTLDTDGSEKTADKVKLPRGAGGILAAVGAISGLLFAVGPKDYPSLHIILDTAAALLSGALALWFWDMGAHTARLLPKRLAVVFTLTFLLEAVHALVDVEWFGPLASIAEAKNFLRPATWSPAACMLPIGIGAALRRRRPGGTDMSRFTLAMIVLGVGLFTLFQWLPPYTAPGLLGVTRPALMLAPLFWAAAAAAAWRLPEPDRVRRPVLWTAAILFLASAAMLYSRAPDDTPAMVAHLGKFSGYLILVLFLMQMASRDMFERIAAEDGLRQSEARYRMLADNATDIITLQDSHLRGLYVSPASLRMLGYTPDELIASTAEELVHPDDLESFLRAGATLSLESPQATSCHRLRRKNGMYLWVEASLQLVPGAFADSARIVTVIRDVGARKQAEDAAARMQALLVDAIESTQDGIALYDADDRLVLMNSALERRVEPLGDVFAPGRSYADIVRRYWAKTEIAADPEAFESFIAGQVRKHRGGDGSPDETFTTDGLWFLNRHFQTRDGGTLTISTDISADKQAAIELAAARDAAEAANRAKSTFLATMSHEIRTPLNGVLGFADLLLDSRLTKSQRHHVMMLRDAGRSLLAIINDVLDISKIEAGKLELERIAMSPDLIVDSVASIMKTQIAAKGLALRIEKDAGVPDWIVGDPTRVRQILLNLVGNALKFTETGHIVIRSRTERADGCDFLRFEVEDSGAGIPADRHHLLFQEFSQADSSTTRRYGGTGLGLSICRRLAEAMGGMIGVTSEEGAGSTFWFTIRCEESEGPGIEVRLAEPIAPLGGRRRILVAEDMRMNQIVIEAFLTRAGHEVTLVSDGADAIEAVREGGYDLVLMDMEMPRMDGLAATRAIRALDGRIRSIPIIALTANAMLGDLERCQAAGMNDFLSKPVDRQALIEKVRKWAGQKTNGVAKVDHEDSAVLDPSVLDELERVLGPARVASMGEVFRTYIETTIDAFDDGGDRAQVGHMAHDLTSAAGNLGCVELMHVARRLSLAAHNGDDAELPGLTAQAAEAARRAVAAIGQRYSS